MNGWLRRRSRQPPAGRSKSVDRIVSRKRPHYHRQVYALSHVRVAPPDGDSRRDTSDDIPIDAVSEFDGGFERKMIRCLERQRGFVDGHLHKRAGRTHPDSIQGKDR